MKRLAAVLALLLVTACAGQISETKSTFDIDNSRELSMEPTYVFTHADGRSGSDLRLSLFWRSTMPKNELILGAFVSGVHSIPAIKSLHFNIDGQIVSLSSIDTLTNIETKYGSPRFVPPYNVSSNRYVVTFEFIENIITANDVRVRLNLGKKYVEGVFSDKTFGAAKRDFVRFYDIIKAQP